MNTPVRVRRTSLVVRPRPAGGLSLDELAREAGVHPELVRRMARIGLIDPVSPGSDLWPSAAAARIARAVRLRRDLGLNYAGALLAMDLVERIDELERRLRRYEEVAWIRTG